MGAGERLVGLGQIYLTSNSKTNGLNEAIHFVISNTISKFLQDQNQSGLRVFNPGLFIIDRQNPNDDLRHTGSYLIFGEHWNFIIIAKVVFFMNSFGKKFGILKNSS